VIDELRDHLSGANMVFVTAGMGGGTGTVQRPSLPRPRAKWHSDRGVVTKPFHFEGQRRMRTAEAGIAELHKVVDTLLIIPNQNLFRVANEKTTFADAFAHGRPGALLRRRLHHRPDGQGRPDNLDFADVRAVMRENGQAMRGTGRPRRQARADRAEAANRQSPDRRFLDEGARAC